MQNLYFDLKSALHSAEVLRINSNNIHAYNTYEFFYAEVGSELNNLIEMYRGFNPSFQVSTELNILFVDISDEKIIEKYINSLREYIQEYQGVLFLSYSLIKIEGLFFKYKYLLNQSS